LDRRRVPKILVSILLLVTAILTTYSVVPSVAAATISISPSSGSPPFSGPPVVSGTTFIVSGSGFTGDAAACTITDTNGIVDLSTVSCTINGVSGTASGSFKLLQGKTAGATSTVKLQGSIHSDTFPISVIPALTLSPTSASVGTSIAFAGSGYTGGGATCGAADVTPNPPAGSPKSCTESSVGTLTGQFTVAGSAGSRFVTVSDSGGYSSSALFTTTGGPGAILTPAQGPTGTVVTVTGSGWNSLDSSVSLHTSVGPVALFSPDPKVCTVSGGSISGCSFTVSSTALGGTYTVTFTGSQGDSTTAQFQVVATLVATPSSGGVSTGVALTGSGYIHSVADCSGALAASPTPLFSGLVCSINANGQLTGSFTVAGTASPGVHTITLTAAGYVPQGTVVTTFSVSEATILLTPSSGPVQTIITVTGSNFRHTAGTCTITGTPVAAGSTCTQNADGTISGQFTIKAAATAGTYAITVTDQSGTTPTATVFLTVTGATINLTPSSGAGGAFVTFTGSGFRHTAGSCTVTGTPVSGTVTCSQNADGTVSGSFTVDPVAPSGSYFISVLDQGGVSPTAVATFVVTGGPAVNLTPTQGPTGTVVTVTGSGWNSLDTSVSLHTSVGPVALFSPDPKICVVSGGSIQGCSFTVRSTAPGWGPMYTVTLTGNQGDTATAQFNVISSFAVSPTSGPIGTALVLSGSGYTPGPFDCHGKLSFSPDEPFITVAATCNIDSNGILTGSLTVGSSAIQGAHSIALTDSHVVQGTVSATFTVTPTPTPTISLNPTAGPPGIGVSISGSGFALGDTGSCTITSLGTSIVAGGYSCSISGGTVSASFTVKIDAAAAAYTIKVAGSTGDFATATFSVTTGLQFLTLNPTQGPAGTLVSFSGFVAATQGQTCSVSVISTSTSSCVVTGTSPSGTSFTGSFVVGNPIPGSYRVRVTVSTAVLTKTTTTTTITSTMDATKTTTTTSRSTTTFGPNYVEATFIVTGATLILNPIRGQVGSLVTFTGSGFSFADHTCTLSSTPTGIITNGACSIVGGTGAPSGSFVVGNVGAGTYTIRVTGGTGGNDFAEATFTVGALVVVSPTTGTVGTIVSVTGTGFASTATSCTLTVTPNPAGAFFISGCGVAGSSGQASGSFTVGSAVAGVYVVSITDNTGESGGTTFTVGAPSATLSISPNVLKPGDSGGISGSGFNPQDSGTCTITPSSIFSSSQCSISSGFASGAFTISTSATPGFYLITVTGSPNLDFASNFLLVAFTTGTVTTSTSTTTSITSTTATSVTTSIPVTLTTTTFTNTGVSTDRSVTITTTTVTGLSTSSIVTTTTTTYLMTSSTSTTVSTMITSTHIFGQAIAPPLAASSTGFDGTLFGLFSVLLLLGWVLFRRWVV
jgi:hypothetical protein